ncbi:hypothetical protein PGTUg99_008921 [Puccinia graminis f. sp. tritici]|uniref:Uncharacterized protein n=1 Tax=Puccinia graminis f. sp. tritici TaxID=56615 RepID=A0A5B0S259_PUCGR|nr:hypothetical protein PGTUg99_008921 [Puccinia graminis f. sp. tritici]
MHPPGASSTSITPDSSDVTSSGSDSDEQLDPKFVVRNAKSKLKAQKNKDKARKQSSQVVRLSKHSELPHHTSALSRSIVEFTKGMLGCYSPSSKLPIPPSTEELEGWENWSSNRQAAVHAAIEAQSEKSHAKNEAERRMMIHNHSSDLKIAIQPVASLAYHCSILIKVWFQIAQMRFNTAIKVFPSKPNICVIFKDVDVVSDYEDSDEINEPPESITPSWRSVSLNRLIPELDQAAILLANKKSRPSVQMLLGRKSSRDANEEDDEWQAVPEKLPFEAYSDKFIADTPILKLRQMGIPAKRSTDHLMEAFHELQQLTMPPSASRSNAMET